MANAVSNQFDDIVIGAGIGGLTCAAFLAKKGRKVICFEKQSKPGGCCVSYEREGFSFAPSVHWLSFCAEDQLIGRVVNELGIDNQVDFAYFDPLVRFVYKDCNTILSFDIESLKKQLKEKYPGDADGINAFFYQCGHFIKDLNNMLEDSVNIITGFDRFKFGIGYITGKYPVVQKVRKIPAYTYLKKYFKNDELINLFYIMGPGDKDAEIFPILARIGWAIDKNYFYIKQGNNNRLAEAFAAGVIKNGGEIRYNCEIENIRIKNGMAVYVQDTHGNCYYAKNIISNIDGRTTYFKLIGREYLTNNFIKTIEKKIPYSSSFVVNLGVNLDLQKMGFKGESITFLPSEKLEDISGTDPEKCKIVIQLRSLRDPSLAPANHHTVMITARLPYDYRNYWTTNGSGIRDKSYYDLKEEIAEKLIKSAEKIIPGLSKHIVIKDIASPLTFERYTGNYQGAIMGWQEGSISLPKLPVKNVYQVGHWTFPGGSLNRVIACGRNMALKICK